MAILPYLEDGFQVTGIAMSPNSSGTNVHKTITARECPGDASLSDTPTLHQGATQHCRLARESWEKLQALKACKRVELDGESLDVASVVAVAKYECQASLSCSQVLAEKIEKSCKALDMYLEKGYTAYGVNTGFGGSADTRTSHFRALQKSLLQHTQSGILTHIDRSPGSPFQQDIRHHSLPRSWVRAAMLIRLNSIIRGHSAVSRPVINLLIEFLRNDFVPVIPLRGTVSASGDLMPLSYIAGALEGNPDILIRTGASHDYRIISAKDALEVMEIEPITLGPKEGLGLINGTAVSAAAGSLVIQEANHIATLTQSLTAMGLEAMLGQAESFHPFISQARPHPGQLEVAETILSYLQGSQFVKDAHGKKDHSRPGLYQDRYGFRTAPQWIGPQLEDLVLANRQILVELNSTTDNPLIDVAQGEVYSGGNFQAASITSAMEKTQGALQMMGRLLYSQSSEIINPSLNNGLPPNLCADEPSLSFTMKGIDVNMAAYMSELSFLSNRVSSHVLSTEMNNQSVNSLALIAARTAMQAVELSSLMGASYLYTLCQALDLRARQFNFFGILQPQMKQLVFETFGSAFSADDLNLLQDRMCVCVEESWLCMSCLDSQDRISKVVESTMQVVTDILLDSDLRVSPIIRCLEFVGQWKLQVKKTVSHVWSDITLEFEQHQNTAEYLGEGSKKLYCYVRQELGVPFHHGLVEHPSAKDGCEDTLMERRKRTIGSWVSIIYESMRNGSLYDFIMQCQL